jgi:K+-sensing histidine kinase KdpD
MKFIGMANPATSEAGESRQLVSDLFHQLSQPLTTLCCSLELALLQTPTAEQYREVVSQALCHAEKVSSLATAIRELFDAGQAEEEGGEILDLRTALAETVSDLLPVAESSGVQVSKFPGPACPVWLDAPRLRQGLFHLVGFVMGWDSPAAELRIELTSQGAGVRLALTASRESARDQPSSANSDQELLQRLGLGIARAIFEGAGGNLRMERDARTLKLEVNLVRHGAE